MRERKMEGRKEMEMKDEEVHENSRGRKAERVIASLVCFASRVIQFTRGEGRSPSTD